MLADVLDFILGGRRAETANGPSIEDARLLGLSDQNELVFQAPNLSADAQFASRVLNRLGNNSPDLARNIKTRKSILNLDDSQIQRNNDGTIEIDFEQFGGQKFKGTLDELSTLQGTDLLRTIGSSALDTASGNTLPNNVVQGRGLSDTNTISNNANGSGLGNAEVQKLAEKARGDTAELSKPTTFLELADVENSLIDTDFAQRVQNSGLDDADTSRLLDLVLQRVGNNLEAN